MVDDLKVYRNAITEKEITRPNLGGGGTGRRNCDRACGFLYISIHSMPE